MRKFKKLICFVWLLLTMLSLKQNFCAMIENKKKSNSSDSSEVVSAIHGKSRKLSCHVANSSMDNSSSIGDEFKQLLGLNSAEIAEHFAKRNKSSPVEAQEEISIKGSFLKIKDESLNESTKKQETNEKFNESRIEIEKQIEDFKNKCHAHIGKVQKFVDEIQSNIEKINIENVGLRNNFLNLLNELNKNSAVLKINNVNEKKSNCCCKIF